MSKSKKSRKLEGRSALSRIISDSTDQVTGFAKQRYMGKGAAVNIAKDLNTLRKILNVERKEVTTYQGGVTCSNSSSVIQNIPGPAQGTTGSTRDGDSIKLVRIDGSLVFNFGTGTTNLYGTQYFKWYLVRYLKTPASSGSSAFAMSEFLTLDSGSNYTTMSLPATDTSENFSVIDSGIVVVEPSFATAVNNYAYRQVDISCEVGFHQTYTGSTAASVCDNALFWVCVALNPSNTGGGSTVTITSRMWFVDN
jgi:hypothetical protein